MTAESTRPARRFNWRQVRWLIYLAIIEGEWYRKVRRIKAALDGKDLNFHKTGQLPPDP
jgi:hypothetical protein